jgi:hypothetical protein
VLAKAAFDLLTFVDEVTAHRLHDHVWLQTRLWLLRNRDHDCQRSFSGNFFGRSQEVFDGIRVEVALTKRGWVSGIKQLAGVPDLKVDA